MPRTSVKKATAVKKVSSVKKAATAKRSPAPASPTRKVSTPRVTVEYMTSPVGVLTVLLAFQMHLKLHHFQTRSYAMHKNTDALYNDLVVLIDALFEHYQGRFPSLPTNTEIIVPPLETLTDKEMVRTARDVISYLEVNGMQYLRANNNSAIKSSVDDISNRIAQFVYLSEFK